MPSGLPTTVTIRSRLRRSISVGPRSSLSLARLASLTRPTAGEGNVIWYRSWLVDRLPDSARSQTSYCSSPSRNLETGRPPTRTRRVSAMVPTGTPRSLAASRSIDHLDLGLAEREGRVEVDDSPFALELGDELVAVGGELVKVGAGQADLEGLRAAASLERRDVVDADPQVGIVFQELAGLLLDLELVERSARRKTGAAWPATSHQPRSGIAACRFSRSVIRT